MKNFFKSDTETKSVSSEIKGLRIIFDNEPLIILERKNELDKKPKYYLLDLENKAYISSLYPTGESNTYLFDVKGDGHYLLRFLGSDTRTYEIEKIK